MDLAVATNERGFIQFAAKPIGHAAAVDVSECVIGFVLGGHDRVADHVINLTPSLDIRTGQQIGIELIDTQSTLGLFGTMTGQAALVEQRCHRLLKVFQVDDGEDLGGFRLGVSFFEEPGFDSPQFFGRLQSEQSLLTIDRQNRVSDSEDKENGDR